jgi:ubiquinone/menaquinone biosynthesis C-methylase UbiE
VSTSAAPSLRAAYDAASATWDRGPSLVYARLTEALLDRAPAGLTGWRVLDLGSGSGTAASIVRGRGGRPVGLDGSLGMVRATRAAGTPSVQGDAVSLPFSRAGFDLVVAGFVLNHLDDPAGALREVCRVLRPRGLLLASSFAAGPEHAVKGVVDEQAVEMGWRPPPWYLHLKNGLARQVADPDAVAAMARSAGFSSAEATIDVVDLAGLDPTALVEYRLGMGSLAEFAGTLSPDQRAGLVVRAVDRLGPRPEPLRPAVLMLRAFAPGAPSPPA